jgi:peptide/nickel transport system substrate-binding protein
MRRKRVTTVRHALSVLAASLLFIPAALFAAGDMEGGASQGLVTPAVHTNAEVYQFDEWVSMSGPIASFSEAPMLASIVATGDLPPVTERLPSDPLVVQPVDEIGQYGGTLRELRDPGESLINGDHWVWEYATAYSPDMSTIFPNVLAGWEWSEDGKSITLFLRDGMHWSDGKPFVADDFMFYWDDIGRNAELFPTAPSNMLFGGEPGTISKISDSAVQISWNVPAGMFVEFMARWRPANYAHTDYLKQFHPAYTSMETIEASMKKDGYETWTDQFLKKYHPQHNPELPVIGPWKLDNYPTDQVLMMSRNPYYWKVDTAGNQLPYIDSIESALMPDAEAMLLKVLAGESDLQAPPGDWGGLANLQVVMENSTERDYRLIQYWWPGGEQGLIVFNQSHKDPVMKEIQSAKRFRIALSVAIDRDEINQTFYKGQGVPSQPTVQAGPPYYGERLFKVYLQHDPKLANGLLDDMGLSQRDSDGFRLRPDGERLRFVLTVMPAGESAEIAELYKGYWEDVGIELVNKPGNWEQIGPMLTSGEYDLIMWPFGLAGRPMNPLVRGEVVSTSYYLPNMQWNAWLKSGGESGDEPPEEFKQIAEIRERAIRMPSEAERIVMTMEIFQMLEDELYMIGAVRPPRQDYYGIVSNRLGNIPNPIIAEHIHEVPSQFYFKQ